MLGHQFTVGLVKDPKKNRTKECTCQESKETSSNKPEKLESIFAVAFGSLIVLKTIDVAGKIAVAALTK